MGRRPRATIESLQFDTCGWTYHAQEHPARVQVWQTRDADAVSLHFFPIPPDLPVVNSVDELRGFHAERLKAVGGKVVECTLERVADCQTVRLLIKTPQQPYGVIYQGAFTIPFRDFSFVVKVQCRELGITGIREAILLDQRWAAGEEPDVGGPDWNPDSPEHDADFPAHPVSRVRRVLEHIELTATLDESVRALPPFQLPTC
jgi:hypothetical protein